ncbi:hypothetical protein [Vibrio sp. ABG19]|uniref:hypothetical protein n=1 Tax=Vibrio sp. ABG19 TaxID=2817385 RepID=UPI00249DA24B|nr:hypothetical protein [Vibrio sp. ABG19]WGY45245.1 hypothetical protein J0X00_06005 [Vibrio sp. ABG19]
MSLALIAGETHSFNVADAVNYGVEQAIILNTIRYWLRKNYADKRNIKDGYVWTYNTAKNLNAIFPYWSEHKCGRLMRKMAEDGLIIVGNHNTNRWNQERWYTLPDFKIDAVDNSEPKLNANQPKDDVSDCNSAYCKNEECNLQNCRMHSAELQDVHSADLQIDHHQDLTQDLSRSIQSPAPGIDPVSEAFQKIFWPLWERRKHARGECLALFKALVSVEGREAESFAKELARDIKHRVKVAQKGFDNMHPKTYLKNRRWEDQGGYADASQPTGKPSEQERLRGMITSLQGSISSETNYMLSIKDNNPLRETIKESCERKLAAYNQELEACRKRLNELAGGK